MSKKADQVNLRPDPNLPDNFPTAEYDDGTYGIIPLDEQLRRHATIPKLVEHRKALEAQWRREWELENTRQEHLKATRVSLAKPQKPLTVGQLKKWLRKFKAEMPVYLLVLQGYDDGAEWEPLEYSDVSLKIGLPYASYSNEEKWIGIG